MDYCFADLFVVCGSGVEVDAVKPRRITAVAQAVVAGDRFDADE
ncbi:hypothetical protein [Rhodococcus sp. APC 3903]|nr:hypothetical protein [Rhodococcus sp. APC 3903]MDN3461129.1 hypothetical protein [Rhodococcus sp. APC 3903]